ncbi:hypothetical protein MPDQ_004332 [Monascus purpureus]|uniref:DUF1754-domain-containing protein n=1 Tax=Monascus purpureus TaxID=5098 RepID=A0A507R1B1_MONPU|nr:hypothetical protein MPDQ_004332 [Monascus purpureus]BDD64285.1 hypothetical protein MAP00_009118 [Monascus purpureus]
MPDDEYSIGGGKLKLKGSKVSGGRVEKKKKKKSKNKDKEQEQSTKLDTETGEDGFRGSAVVEERLGSEAVDITMTVSRKGEEAEAESAARTEEGQLGKTEAERKYEEARRRRLQQRLQREGIKTHKERVEELNKYLSRLTEHHDMPKIGPG